MVFSFLVCLGMIALYLVIGLVVGMLSGFVGIGGGVLLVPALSFIFGMNQHKAQGTSLGALLAPVGVLAFWEYYKTGNADLRAGLLLAIGFLAGGYFGGLWAQQTSELILRRLFGVVAIAVGIRFLVTR